MAQFGGVPDSGLLVGKYLNKVRVYVESSEDRDVLEKWFPDDLGKITFLSADHGKSGGGGCHAVCHEVSSSTQADIHAVGIVDRDKLFSDKNWSLLWEIDDQVFRAAQPYGAAIHVLFRWELENYLLEPKAVHRVITDIYHGRQAPGMQLVEQELVDHCVALVPVMAASVLLHAHHHSSPGSGYGVSWNAAQVQHHLTTEYLPKPMASVANWQDALQSNQQQIAKFDMPTACTTSDRLTSLLRIADGKRLIERIKVQHGIRIELRGFLSRSIKELNLVPSELSTLITALT